MPRLVVLAGTKRDWVILSVGKDTEQFSGRIVLNGEWFCLSSFRGPLAMSGNIFGFHTRGRVLLTSSRERSGALQNIPQSTDSTPPRIIRPKMSIVARGINRCDVAVTLVHCWWDRKLYNPLG